MSAAGHATPASIFARLREHLAKFPGDFIPLQIGDTHLAPAHALAAHPAGMTTLRKVGIASGAAGVVAGALGIFFAVHSKSISDQLDGWSMPWGPRQRSLQSEGENASTRGWIFGSIGAALVFAGAAMYVLGAPTAEHGVAIAPTRGGAEVAWGFAF